MNNIVDKSREYLNTPFHHQGRVKYHGVDCVGLIICTFRELGINIEDVQGYTNVPHHGLLEEQGRSR